MLAEKLLTKLIDVYKRQVLTTFIVMIISGKVTQFLLKKFKKDGETDE